MTVSGSGPGVASWEVPVPRCKGSLRRRQVRVHVRPERGALCWSSACNGGDGGEGGGSRHLVFDDVAAGLARGRDTDQGRRCRWYRLQRCPDDSSTRCMIRVLVELSVADAQDRVQLEALERAPTERSTATISVWRSSTKREVATTARCAGKLASVAVLHVRRSPSECPTSRQISTGSRGRSWGTSTPF